MGLLSWIIGRENVRDITRAAKRDLVAANSWSKDLFYAAGVGKAYYATDTSRVASEGLFGAPSGTANTVLGPSLKEIARILRHLERNNDTVRSIVAGHKADIIGCGMTVIPDTGDMERDAALKSVWNEQRMHIGTAGESDVDLQRMWIGEWDCAGSQLGRLVIVPDRMNDGLIPLACMPFEAEWLASEPVDDVSRGNDFACGKEFDQFGRVLFYHLEDPTTGRSERIPAREIIDSYERKRPRQVLGEPNLVAIIERSRQRGKLIDTELQSAINAAAWTTWVEQTGEGDNGGLDFNDDDTDPNTDGTEMPIMDVRPGAHANMGLGEKLHLLAAERPNIDVTTFGSALDGGIAAASQVSRVWLDRDGSKYNFANSKFDQIRSKMTVKPTQQWMGPNTESRIYMAAVPWLALEAGIPWPTDPREQRVMLRHRLQPDIPPELDELAAFEGLQIGLDTNGTTLEKWHGERGQDWEVILEQRAKERQRQQELAEQYGVNAESLNEPTDEERAMSKARREKLRKEH